MSSDERERYVETFDTSSWWWEKANQNVEKWGFQKIDTLLLAAQEELGELTQAHLEAQAEGGDSDRLQEEVDDLAALCFQIQWVINGCPPTTEIEQSGGES